MTSPVPPAAARIAPGRLRELGVVNWVLWRLLSRAARVEDAQVFSTLGRARGVFRGWLTFSATLMPFGRLGRDETELIIIRVASLRSCGYELDHHVRLARRAGLSTDEVRRILDEPESSRWSPRRRAMLAAVDELVTTGDLGDGVWAALAAQCTERERIELVMLVGHYDALATTLAALRVQRDQARGDG